MSTISKVLITGATGYIGSNLARRFIQDGLRVDIITRPSSKFDLISDIKDMINIHIFDGQTSELINIFESVKPDIVIHLAALFIAEHKSEDILPLLQSNLLFGTQILEAAAKSRVRYFVNTGTHWQNYNGSEYNPVNLYAATKQAFEVLAKYYLEISDMRMLTVKLMDTYGPFDPRPKIMSLFKRIAKSGEPLDMSPGDQELGLLYIDDVVKGFIRAIAYVEQMQPHMQSSCILAPNIFCKLKEIACIFQEVSGTQLNIVWGKRKYRNREIMKINSNEFNLLEHQDTVVLKDGIKMMLEIENGK